MTIKPHIPHHKPRRLRPAGFSLVEALLAAVILSVLMVAALQLFGNLGRSRSHLAAADLADQLALDMILEIKNKTYTDPDLPTSFGLEPGETAPRTTFDDIDDYFNWSACPPCLPDGTPYPQAANLTRAVAVRRVAANDFTQTVGSDEGFKEIAISITRGPTLLARHTYVIPNTP